MDAFFEQVGNSWTQFSRIGIKFTSFEKKIHFSSVNFSMSNAILFESNPPHLVPNSENDTSIAPNRPGSDNKSLVVGATLLTQRQAVKPTSKRNYESAPAQ